MRLEHRLHSPEHGRGHLAHGVLQLPHVSRPLRALEHRGGPRREDGLRNLRAGEEMLGEEGDVARALAQARHLDPHHLKPAQEVVAEAALPRQLLQRAHRRREDAHVHPAGHALAGASELPGLQQMEDALLDGAGQRSHAPQQQRAAVGQLRPPDRGGAVRARPRATEQLRLQQSRRERSTVHG